MYFCVILTENGQRSFLYLINHNNSFMFKVDSYPSQRLINHLLAIPSISLRSFHFVPVAISFCPGCYFLFSYTCTRNNLCQLCQHLIHVCSTCPCSARGIACLRIIASTRPSCARGIACLRASAASMSPHAWPQPRTSARQIQFHQDALGYNWLRPSPHNPVVWRAGLNVSQWMPTY